MLLNLYSRCADVFYMIVMQLPVWDVIRLIQTCRQLREVLFTNPRRNIWTLLARRDKIIPMTIKRGDSPLFIYYSKSELGNLLVTATKKYEADDVAFLCQHKLASTDYATAFRAAVGNDDLDKVRILLRYDHPKFWDYRIFEMAVSHCNLEMFLLLINAVKKHHLPFMLQDYIDTMFRYSLRCENKVAAEKLVQEGANINPTVTVDHRQTHFIALLMDKPDIIQMLARSGRLSFDALRPALSHPEIGQILLRSQEFTQSIPMGLTEPIRHDLIMLDNRRLLDSMDRFKPEWKQFHLCLAMSNGKLESAAYLLEKGFKFDHRDYITDAYRFGRQHVITFYLQNGGEPNKFARLHRSVN